MSMDPVKTAKKLTRRLLDRFGYEMRKKGGFSRLPECAPEDRVLLERAGPFTMAALENRWTMLKSTRYVFEAKIPGAIVECGVWRGGSMMVSALALQAAGGDAARELWLFDTFAGMTKPTDNDVRDGDAALASWVADEREGYNEWCYASLEEVSKNIASTGYPMEKVKFVKGPVEKTLREKGNIPSEIAILRLDTDFYESTAIELELLYPRLAKNGVLIIDDYGQWSGSRKAVDEYLARRGIALLLQPIDDSGARMAIKTGP